MPIPDMGTALTEVVALVAAALGDADPSWAAVADERDLNVPGALVGPATPVWLSLDRLDDSEVTASWSVWLVARDLGPARSLTLLTQMLRAVSACLPVRDVQAVQLNLPNHGDPLPAVTFTITTETSED